jgi:ABC-type branched-subunit amino acid transport system substrate-binding protein
MVSHAVALGLTRAVVCFQDDAFGKDALAQVERLAASTGLKIESRLPHPRLPPGASAASISQSMRPAVKLIENEKPQVALYFGSSLQFSELLRGERAGSLLGVTMLASSTVDSAEVVDAVGSRKANGAAIVQVMPNSGVGTTALVREFLTSAKSMRPAEWRASPFSLEGYLNARIAVEGLRRAATTTSAALHTALADMRRWDTGGITIDFSDGNREGNRYTTIAVIGSDGRLRF